MASAPQSPAPRPPAPQSPAAPGTPPGPGTPGALDVAAFAGELVLVALVAVSGWRLGGGGLASALLAGALVAVVVTTWAVWVAPRSSRRLGRWGRWSVVTVLVIGNAVLAGLAGALLAPAILLVGMMSWLFSRDA